MTKQEALEKLNTLLKELNELPPFIYKGDNSKFDKWYRKAGRHIEEIFENKNNQSSEFSDIEFTYRHYIITDSTNFEKDAIEAQAKGRKDAVILIESFIEEVEEWEDDIIESAISIQSSRVSTITSDKVLIVHGHDDAAKLEVARILEKLNLTPIILHEQPNSGMTIIEKLEHYTKDISYGIVLYTECDLGKGKNEAELKPRSRQNVVFEHGMLCTLIGRKHVMALKKGKVEKPSDIDGILYEDMDSRGHWKYSLIDELKAVGFKVSKDDI